MEHIAIRAELRDGKLSKGQRRILRASGQVLGSVYGRDTDSVSVTVQSEDIRRALATETGQNTLIDLTVDGARHLARIATIDLDTFSRRLMHIGFQKIQASEPRKALISVELSGEPEAVHNHIARLEVGTREIEVRALPEKLAGHVTVDISGMEVGDVLRAGDITLPEGHELLTDPEATVAAVRAGLTAGGAQDVDEDETPATAAEPATPAAE